MEQLRMTKTATRQEANFRLVATAATLVIGAASFLAIPAIAGASETHGQHGSVHQHGAERGTLESPLDVVRDPTDLPPPISASAPRKVVLDLETVEVNGRLADSTMYHYWTFNQKVPGPFLRVRVGDTVEVNLTNAKDAMTKHSIDLHAVTGPGGGAQATQVAAGETKSFTFKALKAGLYVYHCATPPVAEHIASGMYGLILVEPEGGLPKVDREFYVMQGEVYTEAAFGAKGEVAYSRRKLLDERPEYFILNGAVGSIPAENPMRATVGETVRIYFGVGGPNYTSSFHVIGEIFDRVYDLGSLTNKPSTDIQTVTVPPGGAAIVDFKVEVPGRYVLVDHALSRAERGLAGILQVEGDANPDVFSASAKEARSAHGH